MWFDASLVELVVESVPAWAVVLVLVFSYLGSIYVIAPAVAVAYLTNRRAAASWPVFVIGAYGCFVALKPLFGVERPPVDGPLAVDALPALFALVYERAVSFSTESFPSGHAIAATVFWGLLAVDLRVGTFRRRLLGAGTMIAMIAASRVALGVHYPGDVIAGVAIGAGFLAVGLAIRRRVRDQTVLFVGIGGVPVAAGLFTGRHADAAMLLAVLAMVWIGIQLEKRLFDGADWHEQDRSAKTGKL